MFSPVLALVLLQCVLAGFSAACRGIVVEFFGTVFETNGTTFGANGTVLGTNGTTFGANGTVLGTNGTTFGANGTVLGTNGTAFGNRGTIHGIHGTIHGTRAESLEVEGLPTILYAYDDEFTCMQRTGMSLEEHGALLAYVALCLEQADFDWQILPAPPLDSDTSTEA